MQVCASTFLGSAKAFQAPAKVQKRSSAFKVQAADRTLWLPGAAAPKHLDGKMAGDFGFDPLGLGTDPERLACNPFSNNIIGSIANMPNVVIAK
ncbi:hypothetical protein Ndes2526A_g03946 [Nannochloris sp. 'desiccata']